MFVTFEHCGSTVQITTEQLRSERGPLTCTTCNEFVPKIDVSGTASWIEEQVAHKRAQQESGELATRKQSAHQSDESIDRDGLAAELAACVLVCPGSFESWKRVAVSSSGNRGRDLLRRWTRIDKHIEVKQTCYRTTELGFLLVRPPRNTPGRMREEYIDDAYYVLLLGKPYRYELVGWIDRERLIADGELNPVPVKPGQRECWGIHWSKLSPINELLATRKSGGAFGKLQRWFGDLG